MPVDTRARLAQEQAALVTALAGHAAAPPGFDLDRIHAAAASLANKRRRAVARAWPVLAESLGDRFAERFDGYAQSAPLPRLGGPLADGRAFLRWLEAMGEMPEACRLPALAVDLRYRSVATGLVPRRGFAFKTTVLSTQRRLIVGLRLPWLDGHWVSLPLSWGVRPVHTPPRTVPP